MFVLEPMTMTSTHLSESGECDCEGRCCWQPSTDRCVCAECTYERHDHRYTSLDAHYSKRTDWLTPDV